MIDMDKLRGIIPPVVTPLKKGEKVDEKGLRRLIRYLLNGGVHGLFILGSMGEGVALTNTEKKRVMEIARDEVDNKVPVFAGTMDTGTKRVIENVQLAESTGMDAAVVMLPFYYSVNGHEDALEHFREILGHSKLPLFIYNLPRVTHSTIDVDTIKRLRREKRVQGIKDTSCDFAYFQRLVNAFDDDDKFRIFNGDPRSVGASILLGADGAVPGPANIDPEGAVELYEAANRKDIEATKRLQDRMSFIHALYNKTSSSVSGLKVALKLLGICDGIVTMPIRGITKEEEKKIKDGLKAMSLI